ncbi:hypothetical protein FRC19_010541 [Serendipita sp. 401]|nr:hypothetical protein FRC19_010541 [Serendipita sp. 401]KAG9056082.1 hypothetical protein FS842_000372 [Serendipita sp. 407]
MNFHAFRASQDGYKAGVNGVQNATSQQGHQNRALAAPMALGYVHSGYQSAIGNLFHSPQYFANTSVSQAHPPLPRIRPPKFGPGGPIQCGNPGCPYSGYPKDVEIHRMDRHLIFPPGYKPEKGPPDGDLGPNITVPGTGISLKTPEAIDAWIAERKKNWPTDARVAEKKRRAAEALERGELERQNKRPRTNENPTTSLQIREGKFNQRGHMQSARRGRDRRSDSSKPFPSKPVAFGSYSFLETRESVAKKGLELTSAPNEVTSDSDSGSDVDPTLDAISSKLPPQDWENSSHEVSGHESEPELPSNPKPFARRRAREPIARNLNPLIDRPSFLRKLLQHEIRNSVSNLSQAVRFIVANDMFADVELKPGDVDGALIMELGATATASEYNLNS